MAEDKSDPKEIFVDKLFDVEHALGMYADGYVSLPDAVICAAGAK